MKVKPNVLFVIEFYVKGNFMLPAV